MNTVNRYLDFVFLLRYTLIIKLYRTIEFIKGIGLYIVTYITEIRGKNKYTKDNI